MNSSRFYYCFARVRKHRSLLFVNGALCGCEQSITKVVVHSSPTTPFLLNRNRWSTIPPPVFLCCCEARVNCSFYKGLPHAVRSTSVAWPLRMGIDSPARVKSRSEGRSVVKLPVLPIGLLPTPENNTHLFIHPVKSIFFFFASCTIDSPIVHSFRFYCIFTVAISITLTKNVSNKR